MRLDKYISDAALMTRTEATKAIRSGAVSVNGVVMRTGATKINEESDVISLAGKKLSYNKHIYVMLNKPEGYVSATEDTKERTVLDLLPAELRKKYLFPVGRLDKNTLGLLLLTNNGPLAHKLLSPKSHAKKVYRFSVKYPLSESDIKVLQDGVILDDGYLTRPSQITVDDNRTRGEITITEGKFHQIKRMLEAVNNQIIYLERIEFGPLKLDILLERGQWRYLDASEVECVEALMNDNNTMQKQEEGNK